MPHYVASDPAGISEMIGISNRQAYKYERAIISVGAGSLFEIASV